jgi:hypothetical protein
MALGTSATATISNAVIIDGLMLLIIFPSPMKIVNQWYKERLPKEDSASGPEDVKPWQKPCAERIKRRILHRRVTG